MEHPTPLSLAYIGLGSNIGDREQHLRSAVAALRRLGEVTAVSSFYETEPIGTVAQADFLNAVAALRTRLAPHALLQELLEIERQQGRDRSQSPQKGPRTLDLDLLAIDNLVLDTRALTLPHPALSERAFVMVPLVEIAPQWRHPVSGTNATEMLANLERNAALPQARVRKIPQEPQLPY
jgi:2-amino-4-hydroxy-6-hydroxymethyldihydropteridine diphosphokinase